MKGSNVNVAQKIKDYLEENKISLKELAKRTGFSTAILSQVLNHLISPQLGTLLKITNALGLNLSDFMGQGLGASFTIVRKNERVASSRVASKEGVNYGYTYYSLAADKHDKKMEPFIVVLEPTEVLRDDSSSHDGEEFIHVLKGEVAVTLGSFSDTLKVGDSIYYDGHAPHRVEASGGKPATILAVIYPK